MSRAKDTLKLMIGRAAELALPGLAREIDEVRNADRAPRLKRAILYARLRRAHAQGDEAAIEKALAQFWRNGPGDRFHETFAEQRIGLFHEHHAQAVGVLADVLERSGVSFTRLVEIGCGDGKVLAECVRRLPSIEKAVGIDINATAIAIANADHGDDKLSFVNADANSWVAQNQQPNTVLLSNGGVLEYFSPENVDRLFRDLAAAAPAAVMLIEPAAPEHDLQSDGGSVVFGEEYSFSHNYRRRLSEAGFQVLHEEETHAFNARLRVVIGLRT